MRRISPATVTFGVMAIVLGLVAAFIVRQAMHKPPVAARPAPPPPAPEEKVAVVYALYNIPKHTRIRLTDLAVSMVPKDSKLVEGTFRFSSAAEGRIAKDTIRAGQAVRNEYLLGIGEALPDLADRLPEGHRAVTIIVQGSETGGKRLAEGDHVDLAMTVEGTHPDLGEVMTRTLMHNVLVVDAAAGQPLVRGPRRSNPPANLDSVITVAVLPAEANKLIVAQRTGTLHATLVSNLDAAAEGPAAVTDDAVSRRELLGLKEIVAPRKFTVEKWTGGKMQVLEMSDDRVQESRAVTGGEAPVSAPATSRPEAPSRQASGVKQPTLAPENDLVPAESIATTEVATK